MLGNITPFQPGGYLEFGSVSTGLAVSFLPGSESMLTLGDKVSRVDIAVSTSHGWHPQGTLWCRTSALLPVCLGVERPEITTLPLYLPVLSKWTVTWQCSHGRHRISLRCFPERFDSGLKTPAILTLLPRNAFRLCRTPVCHKGTHAACGHQNDHLTVALLPSPFLLR